MPTRLVNLVVDAADPGALARFWADALGWPVGADPASAFGDRWPVAAVVLDSPDPDAIAPFWAEATCWSILGSDGTHVWLRDTTANGPYLDIRRNGDPKTAKLRVHLDVAPYPGDDHAAEVDRLVGLGASVAGWVSVDVGQGDVRRVVLADPEGNEMCVLTPR